MPQTAIAHTWSELDVDHPLDLIDRRRIVGEHVMLSHVTLHAGFAVAPHRHPNEQMAVVLSGRMRFTLGETGAEDVVEVGAGEVLHLPPDVRHGAEALETSVIIDVFSPVSEATGVDQPGG